MIRFAPLLCAVTLLFAPQMGFAQTDQEKGLQIAQEADKRDTGFGDMVAKMTMTLRNRRGEESVRHMKLKILEVDGDGDKSMSIFNKPRDIKGTAMLTFSHAVKPDEQWMYLPALKRVKRISSRNKSGPFMGSEFAFEDLSSQEVEKYTYRWLRDETLNDLPCFVLQRMPAYEHSGYTRQEMWLDKSEYRPQQIHYFDRKGSLLKTQIFQEYHQYLDQYWRSHKILMENQQTGKSTTLIWSDIKFRTGLVDNDFNRNSLKRAR
ncbi:MAG: outer membrane lipoprotein-sorting protein [Magnetococcales bacterium]|nr:outer membrane lipoprotein-sorting protein [Magnetococcales bacterium]